MVAAIRGSAGAAVRTVDTAQLETQEVLAKSYDGDAVPLSIVYPKGIQLDGGNPTHLYGYGAYGIIDDPASSRAFWPGSSSAASCHRHVRGGGEYGEEWHLAGKKPTKPNTWNDFIACAEYLVEQKLHLAAPARQRRRQRRRHPRRPRADRAARPVRAAYSTTSACRHAARRDVGQRPAQRPRIRHRERRERFHGLLRDERLRHVATARITRRCCSCTGINDPRVPPWQWPSWRPALQAATLSGKPVLLRVDYDAGHGIGSSDVAAREEYADMWTFALWQFGDPAFQPAAK